MIHFQGAVRQKCVLAEVWIVKLGVTKVVNQTKPLKYSEKFVFRTDLEQMSKRMATERDTQLTAMQQRLTCVLKKPGCCCLSDKGNEILFRINITPPVTTTTGMDRAGQLFGLLGHQTSHQWTSSYGDTLMPLFTHHHLILRRIFSLILLRQQQPSGSTLAIFGTNSCLCHVVVGC